MISKAFLFDLDGTLLDTSQDIIRVLNAARSRYALPTLPASQIRPMIGQGMRALVKEGLELDESHPQFTSRVAECLSHYRRESAQETALFPGMSEVLDQLDALSIPWGIVTNKSTDLTLRVLEALQLKQRAACIVCGDTLATHKPDPAPVLYALSQVDCLPAHALFVGDASSDVEAGRRAGVKTIVALYGYIGGSDNPLTWGADAYIKEPRELLKWLS
jgi:phosphoglycolate phosphatase